MGTMEMASVKFKTVANSTGQQNPFPLKCEEKKRDGGATCSFKNAEETVSKKRQILNHNIFKYNYLDDKTIKKSKAVIPFKSRR